MTSLPQVRQSLFVACIIAICACNNVKGGHTDQATSVAEVSSTKDDIPKNIAWDIVNIFPHDPGAFTEGLVFCDGNLYESTGEYGSSELRKVEVTTGKVLGSAKLDRKYFGEGIAVIGDNIYQLTYREGKGFIYDRKSMKKTGEFPIRTEEGWGMTTNGAQLIFDDGTHVLHFLESGTFKEIKTLAVSDENGKVAELNELEMIKGFLYANVWKKDVILKIDSATGRVVGRADLTGLRQRAGIPENSGRRGDPEVLNGIAYDAVGNRIFVTGKNWPRLVEIRLDN